MGFRVDGGLAVSMKIGFSSLVCPGWDLETIITSAAEMKFDGVELRGLRGELDLSLAPELTARPEETRALFARHNVELVCLGTSATLDSRSPREVAARKAKIVDLMEVAGALGCPFVRVFAGEVQGRDHKRAALGRIAGVFASLVDAATRCRVTLLVENGQDFCGSDDMWHLADAVGHPALRVCWNQCHAKTGLERPTNSVPKLRAKLGMVHLCDAAFTDQGVLEEYRPLGRGDCEIARQITLLSGLTYEGYLMFEWPKLWVASLPAPEATLPEVATYLRERLADKPPVLTAYKGDKRKPKFVSRTPAGVADDRE